MNTYKGQLCIKMIGYPQRNWLKPSPPAFSIYNLKNTMKMTWLHMLFGQLFVPADSQAKSAQKLKMTLLFLPLYFYWKNPLKDFIKRTLYRALSELNWELLHRNCIGATYISLLEEASASRRRATQAPPVGRRAPLTQSTLKSSFFTDWPIAR